MKPIIFILIILLFAAGYSLGGAADSEYWFFNGINLTPVYNNTNIVTTNDFCYFNGTCVSEYANNPFNPFDQSLNTTDNVEFNKILVGGGFQIGDFTVTGSSTFDGTVGILDHTQVARLTTNLDDNGATWSVDAKQGIVARDNLTSDKVCVTNSFGTVAYCLTHNTTAALFNTDMVASGVVCDKNGCIGEVNQSFNYSQYFDQDLNTTDSVTFDSVKATNDLRGDYLLLTDYAIVGSYLDVTSYIEIGAAPPAIGVIRADGNTWFDGNHIQDGNLDLTGDLTIAGGNDLNLNGDIISNWTEVCNYANCSENPFDQSLNTTDEVQFSKTTIINSVHKPVAFSGVVGNIVRENHTFNGAFQAQNPIGDAVYRNITFGSQTFGGDTFSLEEYRHKGAGLFLSATTGKKINLYTDQDKGTGLDVYTEGSTTTVDLLAPTSSLVGVYSVAKDMGTGGSIGYYGYGWSPDATARNTPSVGVLGIAFSGGGTELGLAGISRDTYASGILDNKTFGLMSSGHTIIKGNLYISSNQTSGHRLPDQFVQDLDESWGFAYDELGSAIIENTTYIGNELYIDCVTGECDQILPPAYAELYNHTTATYTVSIAASGTYYNITGLDFGLNKGFSESNSKLTALTGSSGTYTVNYALSFSGTANNEYDSTVFINGIEQEQCHMHRKIGTGGDVGNGGGTCLISVSDNDVITLAIENEFAANDVHIEAANFNIVRIGA